MATLLAFVFRSAYFYQSLALVSIMTCYGLILLSTNRRMETMGAERPTPWCLMILASLVLGVAPLKQFQPPVFPKTKPLKLLSEIPVTIDNLSLGMTRDQVRKRKGEPESTDLSHFLMTTPMDCAETSLFLQTLLEMDKSIENREELEELNKTYSAQPWEESKDSMLVTARPSLFSEATPKIVITKENLDTEDYDALLQQWGILEPGRHSILFLSPDPKTKVTGLLLSDDTRRIWFYDDNNLAVTFNRTKQAEVDSLSGQSLQWGSRILVRTGEPLERLNYPGPPPKKEEHAFIKYQGRDLPVFQKDLFGTEVLLDVDEGTVDSIRMGL